MKAKISNMNYVYAGDGRLVKFSHEESKPWHAFLNGKTRKFHTHAKAVAWATKRVREGRK